MKSPVIFDLLRRAILSFLLVVAVLWGVAPAYAGDAAARQTTEAVTAKAASNDEVQELKSRLKDLDESTRKNYDLELERGRKQVDWWMTFLALFAAVIGFAIPYLVVRKDKESIQQDKKSIEETKKVIEQDKAQIKQFLEEVKGMKDDAGEHLNQVRQSREEAERILQGIQSGTPSAKGEEIDKAAAIVKGDKKANPILSLRAEAVAAEKANDINKTHTLWAAIAELATEDAIAQFNAGYWASELSNRAEAGEKLYWLRQAGRHYKLSLGIKSNLYEAANNWGSVLDEEARAVVETDLSAARTLWQQAGENYRQALAIKPDKHEAAYNWGNALDNEACAIAETDLSAARTLWQQAGEKYRQALAIKPGVHKAANNWGLALASEARAVAGTDLPAARALWQLAGEKFRQALAIKPDMHEAANNWGSALDAEARTIAGTELSAACTLWQQAGEKYQQALAIKPDKHEAANNWGITLLLEVGAVKASDLDRSNQLLEQAEQLLLGHAAAAPGLVAYNLACIYGLRGDVQNCLKWLRVSQEHGKLPDCKHLREDKDLDPVWNDPAFIEWLSKVCP